ncbi:hypothetical protein [Rubrivivax sp. A210]|uniref:hypothetical protein n=1 Tax=Rubrivivax sp. A210 TaxID=2772301 RepID=UPI00191B6518|nr:hypothetical protein [Rubrivivax sp. A210]
MAADVDAAPGTECPGPALDFVALAPALWLIPARGDKADGDNRGQVVNLLLARQGGRLWLLGAGPSPAFGRALACQAHLRLGLAVSEVAIPRARAELALGAAGLPAARLYATAAVRAAMRRQCAVCEQRLRDQLGEAAADLGAAPVRMPERLLTGTQGRWGPFAWRQIALGGSVTTVWRHQGADVVAAWGLMWPGQPPDGRDSGIVRLVAVGPLWLHGAGSATRFIGEQGPPAGLDEARRQAAYWAWMWQEAQAAVARGENPGAAPPPPVAAWGLHERHALNWQRAWRQAEDEFLAGAPRR